MERLVRGDVVVLSYPFSDFSESKRRPALVIASPEGDDIILCQITSSRYDKYAISLEEKDFKQGSLKQNSFVRPNKLFTADSKIIKYKVGNLKKERIDEAINKIVDILRT